MDEDGGTKIDYKEEDIVDPITNEPKRLNLHVYLQKPELFNKLIVVVFRKFVLLIV